MLGDVLLIEEKHHRVADVIVQKILEQSDGRFCMAVSGESGSGKSELCHVVGRLLGKQGLVAKSVSADSFYKVAPRYRTEWRRGHGVENVVGPEEYDWPKIDEMIEVFRTGGKITLPCVDLLTNYTDWLTTDFSVVDVLIVDGLYSIRTKDLDLRVFLELTYHETKKAQVLRGKEEQDEFRWRVLEQEHRGVESLRPLADFLVSKNYEIYPSAKEKTAEMETLSKLESKAG